MKIKELLKTHPNTGQKIHDFYIALMLEGIKDDKFNKEFIEIMAEKGISRENVETLVEGNPRTLFDFFDANDLYVNTVVRFFEATALWHIEIESVVSKNVYASRRLAEAEAIVEGVKLLEGRLTKEVN